MITTLDYQHVYDTTFNKQYNHWLNKLKHSFSEDDGLSLQTKLSDFRQELVKEYSVLQNGNDGFTDNYFYELVKEFEFRHRKYNRDHIQLFFKNEFNAIQKDHPTNKKSKLLVNEYDDEKTLVYLANFLAIKKLDNDCRGIYPTSDDTAETVLNQILKKEEKFLNGVNKENTEDLPILKDLYYWKYEISEHQKLYDLLLDGDKINENTQFSSSFSKQKVSKNDRTVWKGSQIELVLLLYLLYGIEHKDVRIFKLIPRLFTKKRI